MLRGACVRHAAWRLGGLRAVPWHRAGGRLPLPQVKVPLTVGRLVIHFGPKSYTEAPIISCCGVGGGLRKMAVALLGAHTPAKNPRAFPEDERCMLIYGAAVVPPTPGRSPLQVPALSSFLASLIALCPGPALLAPSRQLPSARGKLLIGVAPHSKVKPSYSSCASEGCGACRRGLGKTVRSLEERPRAPSWPGPVASLSRQCWLNAVCTMMGTLRWVGYGDSRNALAGRGEGLQ